jgi:phage tail tube protein FII
MDEELTILIETRNNEIFLRPRFTIDLDENFDKILAKFSNEFKKECCSFLGNIVDGYVFISISKKEEHFNVKLKACVLLLRVVSREVNFGTLKIVF